MSQLNDAINELRAAVLLELESFDPIGSRYELTQALTTERGIYMKGHRFELVGYLNGVPQYRSLEILTEGNFERLPF